MIASDDGLDTALARVLHEQGSVDLGSLQRALEEVRRQRSLDPNLSLALTLQTQALVSREALERAFQALGERAARGHQSALLKLGIPPDLGPYRVARELSRGGMGAIHEIVHETSGVSFALKTILPNIGEGAGEELERFRREGEALGRLNHPHVVRVHGANLDGPVPYLIQDLLPGGTLQERIDEGRFLLPDALDLIRQLGEGLVHAHERGILHRDLKPLNVLFDDRDQARLVDFGLARFASGSSLTHTGQLLGTPAYMAPEQAMGTAVDERTDVYGLAGILFAVLTGRPPFEGTGLGILAAVVQDPPPAASSLNPEVPRWLDQVLACALAKQPEQRYPSVRAFLDAIEAEQAPPERASWRLPVLALVALLAISTAGVGFQIAQRAHVRSQARDELDQRLSPSRGAPPPFADLERDLPRLRRTIGEETAPVLLASGLIAIGKDDRERSRAVLPRLSSWPSAKPQADLLRACRDARWSEDKSALREALRRLEAQLTRSGVGFREYKLLLARANTLLGRPLQALDLFLSAECPLDSAPWRDLVRRAAAEAAARGKFPAAQAQRLAQALPDDAGEFTSLEEWAEVVRKPNFRRLARLLKASGTIPPPFREPTRAYAQGILANARLPDRPPKASLAAGGSYWGKTIAGLQIRTELPVSTGVFRTLADWLHVANHLDLEGTDELLRVSKDALHSLGPRLDGEHALERHRLFEAYLDADPSAPELGTLGLAATTCYWDVIFRAREKIKALAPLRPASQREFWQLWLCHLAVLRQPPHAWVQPARRAYARHWRLELQALEPWVRAIVKDPARLRALTSDPAVDQITRVYDDLLAVLLFSLARASLEAGEPYRALTYFDEFKPFADRFPNEGWQGEYMITLSRAHRHPATPPAELPRIQRALQDELLLAIQSAHPDHLPNLLHTAWLERTLLSRESYRTLIKHGARLLERRPHLYSVRVRGAWYALHLGQEQEARDLLREASRTFAGALTRKGDRALATKILRASAPEQTPKLTPQLIEGLSRELAWRGMMPLLPKPAPPKTSRDDDAQK